MSKEPKMPKQKDRYVVKKSMLRGYYVVDMYRLIDVVLVDGHDGARSDSKVAKEICKQLNEGKLK